MTRTLLTLAVLALFVLCALAMWWGYRNRARRQAAELPEFPAVPDPLPESTLLSPVTGLYVSTTTSESWQDRVAVGGIGIRGDATLLLTGAGLLVDRVGARALWIPAEAIIDARTDRALAGKVMFGQDGLLVVRWRLGQHELHTGFRGDEKDSYREWVTTLNGLADRYGHGVDATAVAGGHRNGGHGDMQKGTAR